MNQKVVVLMLANGRQKLQEIEGGLLMLISPSDFEEHRCQCVETDSQLMPIDVGFHAGLSLSPTNWQPD